MNFEVSRKKEITQIRVDINGTVNRKIEKINETNDFFEIFNKIVKSI